MIFLKYCPWLVGNKQSLCTPMITKHLFILFLFITSHHQHLPERLEYQTSNHLRNTPTTNSMNKLQTTKHKLLPLAQSRAHMHRQEDNSHPASQRMVTRKTNKRKRKENLNKSVCISISISISISARRIPHAPAKHNARTNSSAPFTARFKFF